MYDPEDNDERPRPPWWFLPAIWSSLVGAAAAIAAAVGLSSSH